MDALDSSGCLLLADSTHYGWYEVTAQMSDNSTESIARDIVLEHAEEAILRFLVDYHEEVENLMLLAITVKEHECKCRDIQPADLPLPEIQERLISTHLPGLASDGYIVYDSPNHTVTLNAPADTLPHLRE